MSAANNTEFPADLRARLEACGDDAAARREVATEVATRLCEELLAAGAPGIHLYPLNFSEPARTIARDIEAAGGPKPVLIEQDMYSEDAAARIAQAALQAHGRHVAIATAVGAISCRA